MENFELFMCCLGNGITVSNKAVMENGDYKIIAHITAAGNIKLYVNEDYIPTNDMEKIKQTADTNKRRFQTEFLKLPDLKQYGIILDSLPINKFLEICGSNVSLTEKLPELREYYFSIA